MVVYLVTTEFSTECAGEKNVEIGQLAMKMWTKVVCGLLFWPTL